MYEEKKDICADYGNNAVAANTVRKSFASLALELEILI